MVLDPSKPQPLVLPTIGDAANYTVGMRLSFGARPRWYVRLWQWIWRVVFRRPAPPSMVVVSVDHDQGVITVDSPGK